MALYFLIAVAVAICANEAFQIATNRWWSLSNAGRYSKNFAGVAITFMMLWFAFGHQDVFLGIVAALAVVVLFWIRFGRRSYGAVQ